MKEEKINEDAFEALQKNLDALNDNASEEELNNEEDYDEN